MDVKSDTSFKAIIARRDPRYDGRFYFGVKTTGIYCRPICPAKPKPENILIFRSPSEAERAGYRACLRCHPDLAPGMKRVDEAERLVSQALRMIQTSPPDDLMMETLAHALGITDRHLRRLFEQQLGASPIEIRITQRLHFARQMIQETSAPMTEIAFAVGFQSIRQFNEAFKDGYHTSPSSFRKQGAGPAPGSLSLKVPIRLPYDWDGVLAYLKRHETCGLEQVGENGYRRYVSRGKKFGIVTVSHRSGTDYLTAEFLDIPLTELRALLARVKNLFDTDHNPLHLPRQGQRVVRGIRVPGSFDPFETAVSIILSQGVSTEHAKQTLRKVVCRYGRRIGLDEAREVFEFPSPKTLARAAVQTIGLPNASAISGLARGVLKGTLDFATPGRLAEMKESLLRIHGIGPWTATIIAMRCLNDVDAFPESDLVIQKALQKKRIDPAAWTGSRAYLTHQLWRDFGRKRRMKMPHAYKMMQSPVGKLKLVASDKGLAAILWEKDNPKRVRLGPLIEDENHPVLRNVERQLNDYFSGKRKRFSVKLDAAGTAFQKKVWEALLTIPFGETRSYAQIARQIGHPQAVRAVGAANGKNPISIIAPCHRVIGSNGQLTGFAGGLETKACLLGLESKNK